MTRISRILWLDPITQQLLLPQWFPLLDSSVLGNRVTSPWPPTPGIWALSSTLLLPQRPRSFSPQSCHLKYLSSLSLWPPAWPRFSTCLAWTRTWISQSIWPPIFPPLPPLTILTGPESWPSKKQSTPCCSESCPSACGSCLWSVGPIPRV